MESAERVEASRLRYSVLRSHETCGTGVGVDAPEPGVAKAPAVKLGVAEGSSNSIWSFGSRGGKFWGSGFRAGVGGQVRGKRERTLVYCVPESSASFSHSDSKMPSSSGIPSSASTVIGKGVSLEMSSMNSERAYRM